MYGHLSFTALDLVSAYNGKAKGRRLTFCLIISKSVLIVTFFELPWILAGKEGTKYIKYLHGDHLHLEIIGKLIQYAKQQEMNFVNTLNMIPTHTSYYVLPNFPPDFPFSPSFSPGKLLVFSAADPIQFLKLFINWVTKTTHMGQDLNTIKNLSAESL